MKTIIIIPVRLNSTRLPQKALADINGKTMIRRVFEQANKVANTETYIACSEDIVANEITSFGGMYLMTDPDLPSGTDRIYAAYSELIANNDIDYIVNVQGDVPNIDPQIIEETINVLNVKTECDIATAIVKIDSEKKAENPNIVKAIIDQETNIVECHNFTRSKPNSEFLYEHIGIYAYRKSALEKFVKLPQSNSEKIEKLEQLRALDNNMRIFAYIIAKDSAPINVDTKEGLELARKLIA